MPKSYLKLLSGTAKHLCEADDPGSECVTLCGCSVTIVRSWIRIQGLEGDECSRCAELAFLPTAAPDSKQLIFS